LGDPHSIPVTLEAAVVEFTTLTVSVAMLIFGVSLLFFLRGRGGPELALARLLADSRRRAVFLAALCASLAALFGIGLAGSIEGLVGTSAVEVSIVETALFLMGAAGIFVLMVDALRTSPLTLEQEWNLKETAARVSAMLEPVPSRIDIKPTSYSSDRMVQGPRP
jgi:hypothetical protein